MLQKCSNLMNSHIKKTPKFYFFDIINYLTLFMFINEKLNEISSVPETTGIVPDSRTLFYSK